MKSAHRMLYIQAIRRRMEQIWERIGLQSRASRQYHRGRPICKVSCCVKPDYEHSPSDANTHRRGFRGGIGIAAMCAPVCDVRVDCSEGHWRVRTAFMYTQLCQIQSSRHAHQGIDGEKQAHTAPRSSKYAAVPAVVKLGLQVHVLILC